MAGITALLVAIAPLSAASATAPVGVVVSELGTLEPSSTPTNWAPVATQNDPPTECADILFVGVRGSGERASDDEGYGRIVRTVRDGFAQTLRADLTVRQIAIDYPSLPTIPTDGFEGSLKDDVLGLLPTSSGTSIDYYNSILEGWFQVTRLIIESRQRCTENPERVVLAAYSQGALVAHKVLAEMGAFPELAAAVLVSDPARGVTGDGRTDAALLMGNPNNNRGVWEALGLAEDLYGDVGPIPSDLAAKTIEICNASDIVCDPPSNSVSEWLTALDGGYGIQVHTAYGDNGQPAANQGINAKALIDAGAWAAHRSGLEFGMPYLGATILEHTTETVPYLLGAGPYSMTARSDGTVYVTSGGNRRNIFAFRPGGTGFSTFPLPSSLSPAHHYGLATDWAGNVYSTQTYTPTLVKFTTAGSTLIDMTAFNRGGWGDEGTALTVDRDGNIYVGEGRAPNYVSRYCAAGRLMLGDLHKLSPQGDHLQQFATGHFRAITSDALGNVYVLTDVEILRIAADGTMSSYADLPENFGPAGADMASDSRGNLYIINSTTTSCSNVGITPDMRYSPIWRVSADTREVTEWASSIDGRKQIAMISDTQLAVYIHTTNFDVAVERITLGNPRQFDLVPTTRIDGTPVPGERLAAVVETWTPSPTSFTYEWRLDNEPIFGETSEFYTVRPDDVGGLLTVHITGERMGYLPFTYGGFGVEVLAEAPEGPLTQAPVPLIDGTPVVGHPLSALPGVWGPGEVELTYQWNANGVPVVGSTADTFTPDMRHAGATIAVTVTGSAAGYLPTSRTSDGIVVWGEFDLASTPEIAGVARVGESLAVTPGEWSPAPDSLSFAWFRSGILIDGATEDTYTIRPEDGGASLVVQVTGHKEGFLDQSIVSRPTATVLVAQFTEASVPTISGAPLVGSLLSAATGTWAPAPDSWEYQWNRDGSPIPGAVSQTYRLEDDDFGSTVTVSVAATREGTEALQLTSASTPRIDTVQPPPLVDVPRENQFYFEITWMAQRGISTGWEVGGGRSVFQPVQPVNRDAMAAFLYRLAGSPDFDLPATSRFVDVPPTSQFYKEITWLAEEGISTGWQVDGGMWEFRPLQPVARDAMAAFLYRFADEPPLSLPEVSAFADVPTTSQFFREISWLASTGVSTGWDAGNGSRVFQPLLAVNRDAMAAFMYRFDRLPG